MIETSSGTIDLTEITSRLSQAQVIETSRLAAPPVAAWEQVASMTGVNAEFMPAVRMTFPRACETLDRDRLDPQRPLVRSVLLLFGVLPVDVHSLALASLVPGRGFLESSSSLLHRRWIHERVLDAEGDGTRICDRVYFECRLPSLGVALVPVVRAIFRHRHARSAAISGPGHTTSTPCESAHDYGPAQR